MKENEPMSKMKLATELTLSSWQALANREIGAIVIDGLISAGSCQKASATVRELTENSTYSWGNDLSIFGVSIGEAHESTESYNRYVSGGRETNRILRDIVFEGSSPIDKVALQMLAIWEPGIRLPADKGQVFLQQVVRRWKTGGKANPHLDPSDTTILRPFGIRRRFGLNVYISMPSEGGAVEFWNRNYTEEEYARARLPAPDYGLSRADVGKPNLKLRPTTGQAILFDASRPHAVEAVAGCGERITVACFFGWASDTAPLFQFA